MTIASRFHVFGELGIGYRCVAELFFVRLRQSDAFANVPAWTGRLDNRDSTVVLFDDDLETRLYLG